MELKKINPGDSADKVAQAVYDNDSVLKETVTMLTSDVNEHLDDMYSHIENISMSQIDEITRSGMYRASENIEGKGYAEYTLTVSNTQSDNASFLLCYQSLTDSNNNASLIRTGRREKNATTFEWSRWQTNNFIPNGVEVTTASISSKNDISLNATESISIVSQHSQVHEVLGKGDIQLSTEDGNVMVNGERVATVDIISQSIGQSKSLVPSQKLFTDMVAHNVVRNWTDALASKTPVTLFDENINDPKRPGLLPKIKSSFNILPFAYADGEQSYLILDRTYNFKAYYFNEVDLNVTELIGINTVANNNDSLTYNGFTWQPTSKAVQEMESQFLQGNFLLPLVAQGDNSDYVTFNFILSEATTAIITNGFFYSNTTLTEGKSRFVNLAANVQHSLHVKIEDATKTTYLSVIDGISKIKTLGGITGLSFLKWNDRLNAPLGLFYSRYMPQNLQQLYLIDISSIGEILFKELPASLNYIAGWSVRIDIKGDLSELNVNNLTNITLFSLNANSKVTGDFAHLIRAGVVGTEIQSPYLFYTSVSNIPQTLQRIVFRSVSDTNWTSAMTDQLIIDTSNANWTGHKTLNLTGLKPRTSASDSAIALLQSKGVTVTVNQ